jgi:hypothetical protein
VADCEIKAGNLMVGQQYIFVADKLLSNHLDRILLSSNICHSVELVCSLLALHVQQTTMLCAGCIKVKCRQNSTKVTMDSIVIENLEVFHTQ